MEKKWYKVSFFAPMTEDDVKAMNSSFYAVMEESMEIYGCEGLNIEEDITQQRPNPGDYEEHEDEVIVNLHDDDWGYDDADGSIAVRKEVFGRLGMAYPKGRVKFCFVDEEDKPVNEYRVFDIDDKKIYCEFIA